MNDMPPAERAARRRAPIRTDDEGLARTRVQFLCDEDIGSGQVRDAILASWWRSRHFDVPADHIDLPYVPDRDPDNPLVRAAEPVMQRLGDQLAGQPISLILTDATGVVLAQRTGDPDLHRHLERVELLPGFSYGEQFVGTNGIGSALESGQPMHVFGHEHYAEHLENLACAGVPIQHPVSGKTIGAIDLTCWRKDAGQLLVALARSTAEQVRQALLTHSNIRELTLFQAYLQTCRRSTGIVIAFNNDIVIMNDYARQLLDPADQAMLLGQVAQNLVNGRRTTMAVTLPTGIMTRVHCRPVAGSTADERAGSVLSVQLIEAGDDEVGAAVPTLPVFLPGVVGSAPLWLRCVQQVDAQCTDGEWLALVGEPGTGKATLARCVHQRRNPRGRMHTLDAANAGEGDWPELVRRELVDDPPDALVIRHLDQLDRDATSVLVETLRKAHAEGSERKRWIAVTLGPDDETNPRLGELLTLFPRTVQVPPLRHHIEDITDLVPLILSRLGRAGQLTCSPAAMHLLMRATWPGNVSQLHEVLRRVAQHRRTGTICPSDLPPDYRTVSRRTLNRLELLERDAIVRGLEEAGGNKAKAAQLLGMSRATIYRKIHEYGIVVPER